MGLVPVKFIHTITSRKSAELVTVDVAATSCLGHSFTPFTALGVNTDSNLSACCGCRAGSTAEMTVAPCALRRPCNSIPVRLTLSREYEYSGLTPPGGHSV